MALASASVGQSHGRTRVPSVHQGYLRKQVESLLSDADIAINGPHLWDIQIHDERLYRRLILRGSLGLGESYMDGWWDAGALDQLIERVLRKDLEARVHEDWRKKVLKLQMAVMNRQSKVRAFIVGQKHYDIGNDLYTAMLDPLMIYSCGYWKDATTLEQAQINKLDLICRKLDLRPGQRVLDIGCGWGGFAAFAAREYGVEVVGITISKEQASLARERCLGLPVEIRLQDYREATGQFDHIVSVGMFEHVGPRNYRTFMEIARRCLRTDGLLLLHTIGYKVLGTPDPWMNLYIFPNGVLPTASQITAAYEGLFIMEDWHNFGADYDTTLMSWVKNFEEHWPKLRDRYGERFYRMWEYYLRSCAAIFRVRDAQLWQIVLSPNGVQNGYSGKR